MAELAVLGCTVSIISEQTATTISITTPPSSDIAVNGKGVYFGDIDVALTAITAGSFTCAEGTITIEATGANVLEGAKKAVLKGDSGTKTLTFTESSSGTTMEISVTVQVTDAGQTDVDAS